MPLSGSHRHRKAYVLMYRSTSVWTIAPRSNHYLTYRSPGIASKPDAGILTQQRIDCFNALVAEIVSGGCLRAKFGGSLELLRSGYYPPSSNRSFNETLNALEILTSVRTEGFLPPRSKSAK
jgi:hypothetical protein